MRPAGALLLAGLLAACASEPRAPRFTEADYPGLLRPPSALGADVLWQQRVTASWGDERGHSFDVAVQKLGDTLTLVGLSPLGSTGFVVELRGSTISHQSPSGEELPFPPRFLLLDVERVFFPWLPDGAAADGERAAEVGGERVVEQVQGGRVVERRFTRLDGRPRGTIVVRYGWEEGDGAAPAQAELDNGWFGYRLSIRTLQETRLAPEGAAAGGAS
jgi:hypothetical protein